MEKREERKNKGFTLIELLAVIIVLGIVMVIAAPQVISSLNTSREKAFNVYANRVLNKANEYVQRQQLSGSAIATNTCLTPTQMELGDTGNYSVRVKYTIDSTNAAGYTLTLYMTNKDKTTCYKGVTVVGTPTKTGCPDTYTACS